jgi:hypothetical protein
MAEAKTQKQKVTRDTIVVVSMKGETGVYTIVAPGEHTLASWANTLSDLTGYKPEWIIERVVSVLNRRYGCEVPTAAGELCPIRFLVTRA